MAHFHICQTVDKRAETELDAGSARPVLDRYEQEVQKQQRGW